MGRGVCDMTEFISGRLTAKYLAGIDRHGTYRWLCSCVCGNVVEVSSANLKRGNVKSCGCYSARRLVLEGKTFGQLTVQRRDFKQKGNTWWLCVCVCGKSKTIRGASLTNGTTRSCGCAHIKKLNDRKFGQLTVLSLEKKRRNGSAWWLCTCTCGNTCSVSGAHLRSGKTISCGCRRGRRFEDSLRSTINVVIGRYRSTAKKQKRRWNLTYVYCVNLFKSPCTYCGEEPSNESNLGLINTRLTFIYNGIDRVNSSQGYTKNNTVPCCITCNRAKNNMSLDCFQRWLIKSIKHQGLLTCQ